MRRAIKSATKAEAGRKACKAGAFTWDKVDMTLGEDACWPWTGIINRWGYGQCAWEGRNTNASRAALASAKGEIAAGLVVCHSCDNPACCNPRHLWAGTQAENLADCRKKGRARGQFASGPDHPRRAAKLTPEKVIEARRMHREGISQSEIARRWGLDSSTVSRAVRGDSWKGMA